MNTLKRIYALLLAVMMIFSLTLTFAFADPDDEQSPGDEQSSDVSFEDPSDPDDPSDDPSDPDESQPQGDVTVTLNISGSGSATLSSGTQSGSTVTVAEGDSVTVSVICDTDNSISLLTVGDSELTEAAGKPAFSYSFTAEADTAVSVAIASDPSVGRDITVGECTMCTVALSTTRANVGATVTATITPDIPDAQRVVAVSVNGARITFSGNTATFTVGEDDQCEVTAICLSLYALIIDETEHGRVTAYPNSDNLSYITGSRVTLTFTPDDGYVLSQVIVTTDRDEPQDMTDSVSDGRLTITTVNRETSVKATFVKGVKADITVIGGGKCSPDQQYFVPGSTVTFRFTPDEGYTFKSLTVDGHETAAAGGSYTCTMDSNISMTVEFEKAVKLTPNISVGGKVFINGTEMTGVMYVSSGSDVKITVTPAANYTFGTLYINGSRADFDGNGVYTAKNVTEDSRIAVKFNVSGNVKTFSVNATADEHGTVTPNGESEVAEGDTVVFRFTPDSGYEVDTVTVNGKKVSVSGNSYTASSVNANITLNVTFRKASDEDAVKADEIDWDADEIIVDISTRSRVSREVFDMIASRAADKRILFKGNGFGFTVPEGRGLGTISGSFATIKVRGNDSSTPNYDAISSLLTDGKSLRCYIMYINTDVAFPVGTQFTLSFGKSMANRTIDYLIFDGTALVDPVDTAGIPAPAYAVADKTGTVAVDYFGNSSFVLRERPLVTYNITASAATGGSINPAGNRSVVSGADSTFIVTAYEGYTIETVIVDGLQQADANGKTSFSFTFENVTNDHTITATFRAQGSSAGGDNSGLVVSLVIVFVSIAAAAVLLIFRWRQENY